MAVQIAAAQAALTVTEGKAKPDSQFSANNTFLFGHLTEGWDSGKLDWTADAITFDGSVPITGPQDETDKVELGFVQIARALSFKAFYAGRMHSEGGIALDYFTAPAMTNAILLDSTSTARDPWYRNPVFTFSRGAARPASTGDHPGMVVRLSLENRSRSNVRNFLFHCFMDREFWTILTALQPGGAPQYIAHVHWQLRYEFKINWKNGAPQRVANTSFIKVLERKVAGRPSETALQALLDKPTGERANVAGKRIEAATVTGNPPNRTDNKVRFNTVRDDFWT